MTGAAVVGLGFIGPVHVEGLRRAGVDVVGVFDSQPQRAAEAARMLGTETWDNWEDLLRDQRVDVVHLATPNVLHFQQARDALLAGKHVLCEKPLAMNSTESAALVELAASQQRAAGVNYNIRYYPMCWEIRQRMLQGDFGNVIHLHGSYTQDWLLWDTDFNWRVLADEGGPLRAVADIGTHWLDLIRFVTGLEVRSVFADLGRIHEKRQQPVGGRETFQAVVDSNTQPVTIDTEDYGHVLFRFANGARGSLVVSQVTAGRKNCLRFEIAGTRQAVAWNSQQPNQAWLGARDEANRELLRDPGLMSEPAVRHCSYPGGHNEGFGDTFKQCFRDFYDYVQRGDWQAPPSFPTFADGHREVVFCEGVLRSHQLHQWVVLEE